MASKLEVLLRLKQASNAAFSFLSIEDPVHSYYVFLKSWGESALAAEYTRQQRLQAGRGEAKQNDEKDRRETRDQEAAAKGPWFLLPSSGGVHRWVTGRAEETRLSCSGVSDGCHRPFLRLSDLALRFLSIALTLHKSYRRFAHFRGKRELYTFEGVGGWRFRYARRPKRVLSA